MVGEKGRGGRHDGVNVADWIGQGRDARGLCGARAVQAAERDAGSGEDEVQGREHSAAGALAVLSSGGAQAQLGPDGHPERGG